MFKNSSGMTTTQHDNVNDDVNMFGLGGIVPRLATANSSTDMLHI